MEATRNTWILQDKDERQPGNTDDPHHHHPATNAYIALMRCQLEAASDAYTAIQFSDQAHTLAADMRVVGLSSQQIRHQVNELYFHYI